MAAIYQRVPVDGVIPLRSTILRPGQPLESCHYPEDQMPGCFHVAAIENHKVTAIASFYPEATLQLDASNPWRLRGMAVAKELQGQGFGQQLLSYGIEQCRAQSADLIWCNARTGAVPFYRKLNFDIKGEEFEIKGIGPHYFMYYKLNKR